jgi:hypothetical protein
MRTHLYRCAAEGSLVYLEAPENNIDYYERYDRIQRAQRG